jgi:choline dehydrogenase-like flavoprotein
MATHYDVIIIGTGPGGGTLAYMLRPSGKKILLLERGGYLRGLEAVCESAAHQGLLHKRPWWR